jgi:hypothetical protein
MSRKDLETELLLGGIEEYIPVKLETLYRQVCEYNRIVRYDLEDLISDYGLGMHEETLDFIRVHKLDMNRLLTDKQYRTEKIDNKCYELTNKLLRAIKTW